MTPPGAQHITTALMGQVQHGLQQAPHWFLRRSPSPATPRAAGACGLRVSPGTGAQKPLGQQRAEGGRQSCAWREHW